MKAFQWTAGAALALAIFLPLSLQGRTLDLPGTVVLDKLAHLYEGAEFDHSYHTDIVEDCTQCHHHTVGIPATEERCARCHKGDEVLDRVACVDCHAAEPFSAEYIHSMEEDQSLYHVDKPGLKAAYHLNCLNCHMEMGGPEGCEDCHERTELGDATYRSGRYAPSGSEGRSTH